VAQSASYFREQAALCLEIARHISEPQKICVGLCRQAFRESCRIGEG
jgi:ribosomal protein S14